MEPMVLWNFKCKTHKQKFLIAALLDYSRWNLYKLADYLDESIEVINGVYQGKLFLHDEAAIELSKLFLLNFGE